MTKDIINYNNKQLPDEISICQVLCEQISQHLSEAHCKIWHGHPVWFLDENPIVGYSKQKAGIRLMFWSGADFEEEKLTIKGKKFKDASVFYTDISQIDFNLLETWIKKSRNIQWDYKNIIKRKGILHRLK